MSATYIFDDKKRGKVHSECSAHIVEAVGMIILESKYLINANLPFRLNGCILHVDHIFSCSLRGQRLFLLPMEEPSHMYHQP